MRRAKPGSGRAGVGGPHATSRFHRSSRRIAVRHRARGRDVVHRARGRARTGRWRRWRIGFAPDREELPEDIALAYAKILKEPPKPPSFEQRWSVWGAGYGGSNRTTATPRWSAATI